MKGKILVFIQMSCLAVLFWQANWWNLNWWSLLILLAAFGLAVWSVFTLGIGNFNVIPLPVSDGIFVQSGPYKLIRHPMYLSIIIAEVGFLFDGITILNSIIVVVLTTDLLVKLEYEEHLLIRQYSNYMEYRGKTKKLIPFIW